MANLWVFNESFAFGGALGANNEYPFRAEYDFIRFYNGTLTPSVAFSGDLAGCGQCGATVRMACTDACK